MRRLLLVLAVAAAPAAAPNAVSGWSYDQGCCSDKDSGYVAPNPHADLVLAICNATDCKPSDAKAALLNLKGVAP